MSEDILSKARNIAMLAAEEKQVYISLRTLQELITEVAKLRAEQGTLPTVTATIGAIRERQQA